MATTMKSTALLLALACMLLAHVEGQGGTGNRCQCVNKGVARVNPKLIEKLEVFASSISCPQVEMIVTLKNKDRKCLDPESKFAKHLMERGAMKNYSHVSPTPAM